MKASPEGRERIQKMLQREINNFITKSEIKNFDETKIATELEQSFEDMKENDLLKLEKMALNNEISLKDLPRREKEKFLNAIDSGLMDTLEWVPWWERIGDNKDFKTERKMMPDRKFVYVVDESDDCYDEEIPKLPKLQKIETKSKPKKKNLAYDLLNIILSYTFTLKLYNGDLSSTKSDFLSDFYYISNVLSEPTHFDNFSTSTSSFFNKTSGTPFKSPFMASTSLRDAIFFFSSKQMMLRALNHLKLLFAPPQNSPTVSKRVTKCQKKNRFLAYKKICYFIDYVHFHWNFYNLVFRAVSDEAAIMWKSKIDSGAKRNEIIFSK